MRQKVTRIDVLIGIVILALTLTSAASFAKMTGLLTWNWIWVAAPMWVALIILLINDVFYTYTHRYFKED